MKIISGRFSYPERHHYGWFRVFWGRHVIEIWIGKRYYLFELN